MNEGKIVDKQTIGKQRAKEILGEGAEGIIESFADISPDFAKYVMEYGYGDL